MPSMLKSLKLLADPTRLRILMLVSTDALSVAELQEILGMGQSRISTQLSQLKAAGLVNDERSGKKPEVRKGRISAADVGRIQEHLTKGSGRRLAFQIVAWVSYRYKRAPVAVSSAGPYLIKEKSIS